MSAGKPEAPPAGRYIIGIDLGTTNIAMAWIDTLSDEGQPRDFSIRQWTGVEGLTGFPTMPAFLWLPAPAEWKKGRLTPDFYEDQTPVDAVPGRAARDKAARQPARVVHSAKSWLAHGGVERREPILPWHSDEIIGRHRRSPVQVATSYLHHLRQDWNDRMARHEPAYRLENQQVIITVPASFDEVAQQLTLAAAEAAGYPENTRLLEEPQAAFYHWLGNDAARAMDDLTDQIRRECSLPAEAAPAILVCDLGGGTADFSLLEIRRKEEQPVAHRLAVSEHIMLGGDNIDLGLARILENRLTGSHDLPPDQWISLLAQCRDLKEKALTRSREDGDETLYVSLSTGAGSDLFAGSLSAEIRCHEILDYVLTGYFPDCAATAVPEDDAGGLAEWGLPWAKDSAFTRHLAGFLGGRPVHGVLFNGGTLKPAVLRRRLLDLLGQWQSFPPRELDNPVPDLAVSRGAALRGLALRQGRGEIAGGYPASLWLEVEDREGPRLLCLVPRGYDGKERLVIREPQMHLRLGEPVRFQLRSNRTRQGDRPGDVLAGPADGADFAPLPPLQTRLIATGKKKDRIRVMLECSLAETGMLQLICRPVEPLAGSEDGWRLRFTSTRVVQTPGGGDKARTAPEIPPAAVALVRTVFGKKVKADARPKRLVNELEEILGDRRQWDLGVLRGLADLLVEAMGRRGRTPEHEAAWLYLTGYCLRPGYGDARDRFRIEEIFRRFNEGTQHDSTVVTNNWWLMWRRLAGGLDRTSQEKIFSKVYPQIRSKKGAGPELILLAGSLERLEMNLKNQLGLKLVEQILASRKNFDQNIRALSRLSSRVPLYGTSQDILRPALVRQLADRLADQPPETSPWNKLALFYGLAGRRIGDRDLDLPEDLRQNFLGRLETAGARDSLIQPVRELMEVDQAAREELFGESLPGGLILNG